ncbi:nucleotide-binding domain-containing protein [Pedobacter deserti]|uniref:nucleotide-binding domain-containing protein n=1 Tax=Pedobacter deserti TaxID=2817382 RepID=UPI00210CD0AB|nr:adenylate/guanylate cyclase domain-containing protein [Pedobacter sp. SYSU D00382]
MRLFENYTQDIDKLLTSDSYSSFNGGIESIRSVRNDILKGNASVKLFAAQNESLQLTGDKALLGFDRNGLQKLFGPNKSSFEHIVIGSHPDFEHIGHNEMEYHHCTSMFVDIKGSSRLRLKYPLERVRLIKDSLLTLCIHVANFFGGHIHRLQGDAVFVQFARRGQYKNDSVINALNAAAVLCQFVEKNLSAIFRKHGLEPIKIRIGIDYGPDQEVLWSHYGVPGCAELTTTSLHTDLAAKLQQKASSNSIIVGGNVIKELDVPELYYDYVYKMNNGQREIDRYIIRDIAYQQYEFLWRKYLPTYDFVNRAGDGSLEITEPDYRLYCEVYDATQGPEPYFQNSCSIAKGKQIRFTLKFRNSLYHKRDYETIEWKVTNQGAEAKTANNLEPDYGNGFKNHTTCELNAAYLGHHHIKCKIIRPNSPTITSTFHVFVQ